MTFYCSDSMRERVMDFTADQVDRAIQFVIEHGAEDRAGTVSYSRLFTAAELPAPQLLHGSDDPESVTRFMKAFHERCIERQLPPLDALVVHVGPPRQDVPGAGYFTVNGWPDPYSKGGTHPHAVESLAHWGQQMEQCRTWGIKRRRDRLRGRTTSSEFTGTDEVERQSM